MEVYQVKVRRGTNKGSEPKDLPLVQGSPNIGIHDPKECALRQERIAKEGKGGVSFASVTASGGTPDDKLKMKKMMEQAFFTVLSQLGKEDDE
eukprot:3929110-Ditylum_brightwellii.AAC.2